MVDLIANADLGGKTVFNMLDAIICAPSEGASVTGDNSADKQYSRNLGKNTGIELIYLEK